MILPGRQVSSNALLLHVTQAADSTASALKGWG
jgi:hypothetical protein